MPAQVLPVRPGRNSIAVARLESDETVQNYSSPGKVLTGLEIDVDYPPSSTGKQRFGIVSLFVGNSTNSLPTPQGNPAASAHWFVLEKTDGVNTNGVLAAVARPAYGGIAISTFAQAIVKLTPGSSRTQIKCKCYADDPNATVTVSKGATLTLVLMPENSDIATNITELMSS